MSQNQNPDACQCGNGCSCAGTKGYACDCKKGDSGAVKIHTPPETAQSCKCGGGCDCAGTKGGTCGCGAKTGGMRLVYFKLANARGTFPALVAACLGMDLHWDHESTSEWPKSADKTPFLELPVLYDGDVTVGQSLAIVRYLGTKGSVTGNDVETYAKSEMLVEEFADIFATMAGCAGAEDKEKEYCEFFTQYLPQQFAYLEKLLPGVECTCPSHCECDGRKSGNCGCTGKSPNYFCGTPGPLIGDLAILAAIYNAQRTNSGYTEKALKSFPKLSAWRQMLLGNARIASFFKCLSDFPAYFSYVVKPKLIYFNARGKAEVIRLMLAEAKVDYTDQRLPNNPPGESGMPNKALEALKATGCLDWNQVPAFEIDGEVIVQARAIERYVACRYGLVSKDPVEAAHADSVCEALTEISQALAKIVTGTPESKQEAMRDFVEVELPKWGALFENKLKKMGTGFYGRSCSYADISAYYMWNMIDAHSAGYALKLFPAIKAHTTLIGNRPGIKAWVSSRPKTQF